MAIRAVLRAAIRAAFLLSIPSPVMSSAFAHSTDMAENQPRQNQRAEKATNSPLTACSGDKRENGNRAIRLLEVRSVDRIEEDLTLVDGINVDRDVLVVACRSVIWTKFSQVNPKAERLLVQVRAWRKPPDGGWLEMRLNEPSLADTIARNPFRDADRSEPREVNLAIDSEKGSDPVLIVPLRRDAVKPADLIRIRIRIGRESTIHPPPTPEPPAGVEAGEAAPQVDDRVDVVGDEDVLDQTYAVGRFGLHVRFSDMALFVQRLGEDRVNASGTNPVLFDSVNFRPAPGVNYGFNYYHRRHASIRMLEPGFGLHIVFLNWNDRRRGGATADTDVTQVTNLQIGIGVTGSMFDGTVVGALGWNLHVKDQRPYLGIGFSITGLARKIAEVVRE